MEFPIRSALIAWRQELQILLGFLAYFLRLQIQQQNALLWKLVSQWAV
jgi:hypothetical protein